MKTYTEMNKEELLTLKGELEKQYEDAKALHLALDMSRGKPAAAQLDLSMPMMSLLNENSVLTVDGRYGWYKTRKRNRIWKFQPKHYVRYNCTFYDSWSSWKYTMV